MTQKHPEFYLFYILLQRHEIKETILNLMEKTSFHNTNLFTREYVTNDKLNSIFKNKGKKLTMLYALLSVILNCFKVLLALDYVALSESSD